MKKSMLLICLVIQSFMVAAQNVVPNNGFETYSALPSGPGSYALATGWTNCNGGGSPDYFHINGSGIVQLPNCFLGTVYPLSGDAVMGFCLYYPTGSTNFREYLSIPLTTALTPGNTYNVSFHITNGIRSGQYGGYGIDQVSACFSTGALTQPGTGVINVVPQITVPGILYDSLWQYITLQFTATAAFDQVTFGNFKDDANTNATLFFSTGSDPAYYFLDDVSVQLASALFFNTCVGDSTVFQNITSPSTIATSWDFGDPSSGLNNFAYSTNATHYFTAAGTYNVTTINYQLSGINDTLHTTVVINPMPSINLGNDTLMCIGDSIILDAGAGFTGYIWSDSSTNQTITVLSQGIYTVEITDGGCTATDTIIISTQLCSTPVVALASSDTNFCENQCINFFDLSTNNPISWQWFFPGADSSTSSLQNPTNICYNSSGNFDVTLIACNALGCDTLTFTNFIHADAVPSIYLGNDTLMCIGDSLVLDAGAGFTAYLWSDNSTNQTLTISSQGIYTVEITSGACSATDTIIISTQLCAAPFVSLASSDTNFCEKQCISFYDLSTNNPTSWQWLFPGSDSLTSTLQNPTNICYNSYGSFDVTLIACNTNGCDTLSLPNFITEYQSPVDSIYQSNDTLFSLLAYSYQWYEVTNGIIAGATNQYFVPQQAGSYYCIITDSIGCAGSSGTIVITATSQISNFYFPISIYPNPFDNNITIIFQKQNISKASITIKNVLGQNVYSRISPPSGVRGSSGNNSLEIDLLFLPKGIYLLDVMMDDTRCIRKIVKD
ncbi:MAG: PKD domain-containing protein [Bacteroidia bacterium]